VIAGVVVETLQSQSAFAVKTAPRKRSLWSSIQEPQARALLACRGWSPFPNTPLAVVY
jgi:hypothetical protein